MAPKTLKAIYVSLVIHLSTYALAASNEDCRQNLNGSMEVFRNYQVIPDTRAVQGVCLIRYFSDRQDAAALVLRVIKDPEEDILLREDLIEALGAQANKRSNRLESSILGPRYSASENKAQPGGKSGALAALSQAAKSMEEITPSLKMESDFVKVLGEITQDETNHVQLRTIALSSWKALLTQQMYSGNFDEKWLRGQLEMIQKISVRNDNSAYFIGAELTFRNLNGLLATQIGNSNDPVVAVDPASKDSRRDLASPEKK